MRDKYYLYILASKSGTLYVGITNNILRRIYEHKNHLIPGFTDKYDCHKLIYYEEHPTPISAIAREKQIKNWRREKKEKLIKTINPGWIDLMSSFGKQ
jgi:putative endonuclease